MTISHDRMKEMMAERQAEIEEIEALMEDLEREDEWFREEGERVIEWWEDPEWERRYERG